MHRIQGIPLSTGPSLVHDWYRMTATLEKEHTHTKKENNGISNTS